MEQTAIHELQRGDIFAFGKYQILILDVEEVIIRKTHKKREKHVWVTYTDTVFNIQEDLLANVLYLVNGEGVRLVGRKPFVADIVDQKISQQLGRN